MLRSGTYFGHPATLIQEIYLCDCCSNHDNCDKLGKPECPNFKLCKELPLPDYLQNDGKYFLDYVMEHYGIKVGDWKIEKILLTGD